VRRIACSDGIVSTVAGTGAANCQDGRGTAAVLSHPFGLVVSAGWKFFSEHNTHCIRCISPSGQVTTIAGLPGTNDYVDHKGTKARFTNPTVLTRSGDNICVMDGPTPSTNFLRIRLFRVDVSGGGQVSPGAMSEQSLPHALATLIDNPDLCDVALMAENRPLYSLSGLLRARCPLFANALCDASGDAKQAKKSHITIPLTYTYDAVRAGLMYLHTDELRSSPKCLVELMNLSLSWQVTAICANCFL
jgi:hypothetical protein